MSDGEAFTPGYSAAMATLAGLRETYRFSSESDRRSFERGIAAALTCPVLRGRGGEAEADPPEV